MASIETDRYVRTELGRNEIHARSVALSRSSRNLLLMIDDSRSGSQWVACVRGSTPDDLRQLFAAGLIAPVAARAAAPAVVPVVPVAGVAEAEPVTLEAAVERWSYEALYGLLTSEVRERFGLIRGYRLILQIESCANVQVLRQVAIKVVESVRRTLGDESAARLREMLGATA
ncbi:MAG: hypothetical protein ABW032_08460 [Burkholderiaceae bacterium]